MQLLKILSKDIRRRQIPHAAAVGLRLGSNKVSDRAHWYQLNRTTCRERAVKAILDLSTEGHLLLNVKNYDASGGLPRIAP